MSDCPTRTEDILFRFTLDYAKARAHRLAVREIRGASHEIHMKRRDRLHLSYSLSVSYMDDVPRKLAAIEELIDSGCMLESSLKELRHGRSLFASVVSKLDDIIGTQESAL